MQTEPDTTTRLGGWLFRRRTALPIPIAVAILMLRVGQSPPSRGLIAGGIVVTAIGELLRLWGVHHIGAISRTRSERLGPLVASGPFAWMRNPLYAGNVALWVGFTVAARLVWLAPIMLVLLGIEYHAIVRWEERLLESRLGESYRDYAARVPRWVPVFHRSRRRGTSVQDVPSASSVVASYSWRDTLFSERGTLIAIAVGYLLLWVKLRTEN